MYIRTGYRLVPFVVVAGLVLTACSPSPKPVRVAGAASPSPVVAASPSPSVVAKPLVKPKGPPPKKGTLAWYVYELPHFGAAPVPTKVEALPVAGPAKQINRVDVGQQKVAFITIDDGWMKDPAITTLLRAAHIPFTMFLTTDAIKSDPKFFKTLQGIGGVVEDHTVSHPELTRDSYAQQKHEICDSRATLTKLYGRAPVIMRAPYGLENKNTLKAAASCGIRANVFWDEYAITGTVTWQRPGGILPGDMVLMHFDKYLKANLVSALKAFHKNGITPALLENYLVTTPPTTVVPNPSPGLP
jgi:peptidoglycan/xylan/chitin deacetylase (PgdA/CDA1 family)